MRCWKLLATIALTATALLVTATPATAKDDDISSLIYARYIPISIPGAVVPLIDEVVS